MLKKILRYAAFKHGKFIFLYHKICKPRSDEYADFLRVRKTLYSIGEGSRINPAAVFTDPKYVQIGSNTCLSSCSLIGHDGAVAVFAKATGKAIDKVGKIAIGNNCFIGFGAVILPDVTIGDFSIVAAGAVVNKDVESGTIVGGIPAKVIGKTEEFVNKLEENTKNYPWYDLIKSRQSVYDDNMEKELLKMRLKYFFES